MRDLTDTECLGIARAANREASEQDEAESEEIRIVRNVLQKEPYSPWSKAVHRLAAAALRRNPVENIRCAAIYVDTGEADPPRASYAYPKTGLLFTGLRHGDCFTTLVAWERGLTEEQRSKFDQEQLRGRNQGFLTSLGRYVDRAEGMKIARAAGQTDVQKTHLFSEDLY